RVTIMSPRLQESYANLEQKVDARTRDLTEALETQTATAHILRVISSSPTNLQPVFDAITESAVRLSGSTYGAAVRVEDGLVHHVGALGQSAGGSAGVRLY